MILRKQNYSHRCADCDDYAREIGAGMRRKKRAPKHPPSSAIAAIGRANRASTRSRARTMLRCVDTDASRVQLRLRRYASAIRLASCAVHDGARARVRAPTRGLVNPSNTAGCSSCMARPPQFERPKDLTCDATVVKLAIKHLSPEDRGQLIAWILLPG
jgi:hypothetical protein